jgi:hypothetical protein
MTWDVAGHYETSQGFVNGLLSDVSDFLTPHSLLQVSGTTEVDRTGSVFQALVSCVTVGPRGPAIINACHPEDRYK